MALNIFGFEIKRKSQEEEKTKTPIYPENDDGSYTVSAAGMYGQSFTFGQFEYSNEQELIKKYRNAILTPEVESAVDHILNDSLIFDSDKRAVDIRFRDGTQLSDSIKTKIDEEFSNIYNMLDFQQNGHDYFRSWYIDGRLAMYKNIDPKKGILSIQPIDSLKIKKVKTIKETTGKNGVPLVSDVEVHYEYARKGFTENTGSAIKLTADSVSYITSGLLSEDRKYILSHLHKAIKPINQLNMMEDAVVIYRISRAPERRIFYIDVGNLPRQKAEQYVKDVMNKYRNKLVYNPKTGEIDDKRKYQTMLEDYWLPRREGGRGTQVDTLPGGQSMNQLEDLEYFLRKVYKSLNIPFSRFQSENQAFAGRATEITRDELTFARFIQKLRSKFAGIFYDLLRTQLIVKKVIKPNEWEQVRNSLYFYFNRDSYFQEAKDAETLQNKLQVLRDVNEYRGIYFSTEWIMKNVLHMDEEQIKNMYKTIESEKKSGIIPKEDQNMRF